MGGILAWLFERLIRWIYREKYDFTFEKDQAKSFKENQSKLKGFVASFLIIGLLVSWYLDETLHMQIRLMPLWFGLIVCLRGIVWLRKRWTGFGLFHIFLSVIPFGMSIAPFVMGISSENKYFGIEGFYELSAIGLVIIAVSIIEHLIILNIQKERRGLEV